MTKISAKPPSGFRDFSPAESAARIALIRTIESAYGRFGFRPIATAICENIDTLLGKGAGADNEHLLFKIMRRGEALQKSFLAATPETLDSLADLGMRFELTLSLARYVSRFRNELVFPFKAFQIGNVYRAERAQKGRYREFIQCDADVIGCEGIGAELDVLQAMLAVFREIKLEGVTLVLNDRRLLDAAAKAWNVPPKDWNSILVSLDKLDKIGVEAVLRELSEKGFAHLESKLEMRFFSKTSVDLDSWTDIAPEEVQRLQKIITSLQSAPREVSSAVRFSPTMVRGQEYYTGTIFELHHPDVPGSLGGGGRYDKLLQMFGGPSTPCFGGSIGFERLFQVYLETLNSSTTSEVGNLDVFFPVFDEDLRLPLQAICNRLRAKNISAELFPEPGKLKQQFRYADQRGARRTVSIGPDEYALHQAKIKMMATGEEKTIPLDRLEMELKP